MTGDTENKPSRPDVISIDYPATIRAVVEADKVWFDLAANVLTATAFAALAIQGVSQVKLGEVVSSYGLNIVTYLPLIVFSLFLVTRLTLVVRNFSHLAQLRYASSGHPLKRFLIKAVVWMLFLLLSSNLTVAVSTVFLAFKGT